MRQKRLKTIHAAKLIPLLPIKTNLENKKIKIKNKNKILYMR